MKVSGCGLIKELSQNLAEGLKISTYKFQSGL